MLINKHKSWPRLLGKLEAKKNLFNEPCENELAKDTIAPVATVAKIISTRTPEILKKDNVRICIAGAELHDTLNKGDIFNLLPILLDDFSNYHVDMIGDKVDKGLAEDKSLEIKEKSQQVVITKYDCLLGSYLKNQTPDVIIMLHPGFEEYHKNWLVDDNGISEAISNGIKVFGASYGDESPIDKLYLNSHGYNIINVQNNPFSKCQTPPSLPINVSTNIFEWAAQTWEIEKSNNYNEEFISGLLPALHEIISLRASTEDIPVSGYYTKTTINDHGQWFNIFNEIYVSFKHGVVIDFNSNDLLCQDIEIDISDIGQYKDFKFLFLSLKCAIVHKDYLRPYLEKEQESKEDRIFTDIDEDEVTEMMLEKGNHSGNRMMNSSEKSISSYFKIYEGKELLIKLKENYSNEILADFLDDEKYNLLHIGCSTDNVELIEFAKELDLDPDQRNSDMYSPLDLCVADGGMHGIKRLIKLYPDIDVNSVGAWGFTALHHTKTRGKPDMADLLKKHGAKDNIKNHAGLAYKDMQLYIKPLSLH